MSIKIATTQNTKPTNIIDYGSFNNNHNQLWFETHDLIIDYINNYCVCEN